MIIGFDAKRIFNNVTGLGNYSRTLVSNLYKYYPNEKYHFYTPGRKSNVNVEFVDINLNSATHEPSFGSGAFWRSMSIPGLAKRHGVQVYHGLSNELPLTITNYKFGKVVTIHDLIFRYYPSDYPVIDRKIYDFKSRHSCRVADKIIAVSENTKKDIVDHSGIAEAKIEVIYQCCDPLFYEDISKEKVKLVKEKYGLPTEFLLYIGSVNPRKNLKGILRAYPTIPESQRIPLIVIGGGKKYKKESLLLAQELGISKWIRFEGSVHSNEDIAAFYKASSAFIYPSFYEGFGIPVVEALLMKTPVITAATSSLPEAGGPSSIFINPKKPEEIAEAILEVISDSGLQKRMVESGYAYANDTFDPKKQSVKLMDLYNSIL